jgi:hypothetical protein
VGFIIPTRTLSKSQNQSPAAVTFLLFFHLFFRSNYYPFSSSVVSFYSIAYCIRGSTTPFKPLPRVSQILLKLTIPCKEETAQLAKVIPLAFDILTIDTDGNGASEDGHTLFGLGNTLERSRDEIENPFNDQRYIDIQTADLIIRQTPYTPFRSENARHRCHTCNRPPDTAHHSDRLRKPTSIGSVYKVLPRQLSELKRCSFG